MIGAGVPAVCEQNEPGDGFGAGRAAFSAVGGHLGDFRQAGVALRQRAILVAGAIKAHRSAQTRPSQNEWPAMTSLSGRRRDAIGTACVERLMPAMLSQQVTLK